ncbi:helix-turn-helix domain-containing protein [Streptomyces californicus]|uniref:helix-turn-helix domain-containing protein n=1 Tax=Streptomyces TaxID=1883 RepID=UPI001F21CEDD|nr:MULTISPECIES: helix-turn-helix domain-containing protein [Streptomyces]MCF3170959.1 helix-turn-helix domain-containing protein [Streptomyces violaceoruber]MDW4900581.1 helix-turn-helix domain-containing protein [Streptomyces californicus]
MEQHNPSKRDEALALLRSGTTNRAVAEHLDVPRGTVGWWLHEDRKQRGVAYEQPTDCPVCTSREVDRAAYAYLLGLYLGDGHITSRRKQHHLSIFCDASWPGVINEAEAAMAKVMPMPRTGRRQSSNCVEVKSYSKHWTCAFPQHGPGKKHERPIALEAWQQEIVDSHPWHLIRGLVHSDGCRNMNWTTRVVKGELKRYEYPRYYFTNVSDDIRRIYTDTLDALGVVWTHCTRAGKPYNISVARRASVALMDAHVGPKY